ncbi:MAG: hypothetical protein IJ137_12215 [Eubacterium sp.]|nr:hypothetical protein [Eubacterium sp.]
MKNLYDDMPDGYQESIQKGLKAVRHFGGHMSFGTGTDEEKISRLKKEIETADAIVIGAGAGLSTAAGLTYSGERFERYFFDFAKKYGIRDIYSGGFYPFPDEETRWAWWARHIYYNRYIDPPKPVYHSLLELVKDKDYFVITTNVDHQFQRAGFDKKRLFYTQGDYGLFQSVNPSLQKTYDNEEWVRKAMDAQGFCLSAQENHPVDDSIAVKDTDGIYQVPEDGRIAMRIPSDLIPKCPDDGSDVTMNLRADDSFVEDEGWHRASAAYSDFLRRHENLHVLYLELGVGANTPVIVKYPFWQMTLANEKAVYACINYGEAFCPGEIEKKSICINGDIAAVLEKIK